MAKAFQQNQKTRAYRVLLDMSVNSTSQIQGGKMTRGYFWARNMWQENVGLKNLKQKCLGVNKKLQHYGFCRCFNAHCLISWGWINFHIYFQNLQNKPSTPFVQHGRAFISIHIFFPALLCTLVCIVRAFFVCLVHSVDCTSVDWLQIARLPPAGSHPLYFLHVTWGALM